MLDKVDSSWTAGFIGAQVAMFVNPLEVAKTRLQLIGENRGYISSSSSRGLFDVWKKEGMNVLTKGSTPSALHCALTNIISIQMLKHVELFGITKPSLQNEYNFHSSSKLAFVIGLPVAILTSPLNLAKIRIQSLPRVGNSMKYGFQHQGAYKGAIGLLGNVYQTEFGPIALFRAAVSSHIKFTTMTSVAIYSYVKLRQALQENEVCSEAWKPAVCAAAAATAGAFVATPIDLLSTRMYNQGVTRYGGNMQYKKLTDCLFKTISKEGLLGLYKHSLPATVSLAVPSAIALYLWDYYGLLYHN